MALNSWLCIAPTWWSSHAIRQLCNNCRTGVEPITFHAVTNMQVYVLADTSYNPLSVDEVAAAHVNADCVVSQLVAAVTAIGRLCGESAGQPPASAQAGVSCDRGSARTRQVINEHPPLLVAINPCWHVGSSSSTAAVPPGPPGPPHLS
jgi:hypothetical protein